MKRGRAGLLLLVPAGGLFLLSAGIPTLWLLRLSLFDSSFLDETWVGLGNFLELARDPVWWRSAWNTLLFVLMIVPAETFLSFSIALLLANEPKRMQSTIRFLLYLPSFVSGVILANVWRWIWDYNYGIANWVLGLVGLGPVNWWLTQFTAIFAISVIMVLLTVGSHVVVFLAVVQSIPRELYEAATVDGARWGHIRWRIVAPALWPTAVLVSIIGTAGVSQLFYLPLLLTSGGPMHGTTTMMLDIWLNTASLGKYGLASAKSLVLCLLTLGLAVAQRRVQR